MLTAAAFLFFSTMLLLAALLEPVCERFGIPFSIFLVVLGYAGSETVTKIFNLDTGIRWDNISQVIFYGILPVLIFQASLEINIRSLWKDIVPIALLSFPLLVLSAAITAVGVFYGIHHPGFPWDAALLTGALLCATDPAAVLSLLKKSGAPKRLVLILEAESLFNDATAIVLYSVFAAMAISGMHNSTWNSALMQFISVFFGGLAVGVIFGIIARLVLKLGGSIKIHILITFICAYASFILTDKYLNLSGVMAVLAAGLIMGSPYQDTGHDAENHFVGEFWGITEYFAEGLIFLLAGVTINIDMFTDQWLAILIGIAAVLAARVIIIFGIFPLMNRLPHVTPVPFNQQVVLTWGGVRGTVTLALALSLPLSLGYWYTIQSIAYGVVLFTLFVQTTTMNPILNKLKLNKYSGAVS
jgi:CPA1 family monovalent cation:H+ antiporter